MLTEKKSKKESTKSGLSWLSDGVIGLFLVVTIPHTAFVLMTFEFKEWWLLGWFFAGAIDIGIAFGGLISSNVRLDKATRRDATILFAAMSLGSYCLNIAHYVFFHADWFSLGLAAFFPIGTLMVARIKARLDAKVAVFEPPLVLSPTVTIDYFEAELARRERLRIENEAALKLELDQRETQIKQFQLGLRDWLVSLTEDLKKTKELTNAQIRALLPDRQTTEALTNGEEVTQVVVPVKPIEEIVMDIIKQFLKPQAATTAKVAATDKPLAAADNFEKAARDAAIAADRKARMSRSEVAAKHNVSVDTVDRIMRKAGA